MASLVISGTSAYLTAAYPSATVAINIASAVAATAAYAYIDQPYIIPALFGEESGTKDQNRVGNLKLPTTNPGEPRYRVYGREAYVPGHFLWIKNQKVLTTTSGGGSGKGATALSSVSERFADIGIAVCDGPIMNIVSAMSNRSVFYGERSVSGSVFSDPRIAMASSYYSEYYGTRADNWDLPTVLAWGNEPRKNILRVEINPSFGVTELMSDHFDAGDVVELFNVGEGDQRFQSSVGGGGLREGIYAVLFLGKDQNAAFVDYMELLPLAGQNVYGLPGGILREDTEIDPVVIKRVDECVCGYTVSFNNPFPLYLPGISTFNFKRNGISSVITTLTDYEIYATPFGSSGPRPEILFSIEVCGSHGGYQEIPVNINLNRFDAVLSRPFTKMGRGRLRQGNNYELQGFCNVAGLRSLQSITARLDRVLDMPPGSGGDLLIQSPRFNNTYTNPGKRYVLEFRCYQDEMQSIIDELATGGSATVGTKLYPGNGQFNPYKIDPLASVPTLPSNVNAGSLADLSVSGAPVTDTSLAGVIVTSGDPYGLSATPLRRGGASPSERGGLGDVGFCILPIRQGNFTYRTSLTGPNIGPQSSEFNNGSSTQQPITNSEGISYRGLAHVSFTDLNLYQFGNAIPQASFKVRESEYRSVGDIVTSMIEESAPFGSVLPGFSTSLPSYGYSVAGGTPTKQAIQPLAVAYGFSMQERAGKLAMLQDSELPIIDVPPTKLNAREYGGSEGLMKGLQISQIDSDDLPQRVVVKYLAVGSGNEEARAAGIRSPGSLKSGERDTIEYNLRPLVMTNGYAKTRAQQLLNKSRTESSTSSTVLPPSRMDVLPGTVISTGSNNDAATAPSTSTETLIGLSDSKGDVIPGSVSVNLRLLKVTGTFSGGNYAEEILSVRLVDDGDGLLIGLPNGITFTSNVDYTSSGQWLITTVTTSGVTIIDPSMVEIRYQYFTTRTFRATKATLSGYDFTVATPLVSTLHDHTFPSYQHNITFELPPYQEGGGQNAFIRPSDDPSVNGPWGDQPEIGIALVAPTSGGATIYESEDGVSDWTELGQIFGSARNFTIDSISTLQTTFSHLPRWETSSTVESWVDYGLTIVISGVDWPPANSGTVTVRQVVEGHNNFLVNGEVIGATTVLDAAPITILQGIIRGLRGTRYAAGRHAVGDEVVHLPRDDNPGIGHFSPAAGHAGTASSRFLRAVVPGSTLSLAPTQTVVTRGTRALPGAPLIDGYSLTLIAATDAVSPEAILFKWGRPPTAPTPIFGLDPLPSTYNEQYEVYAFQVTDIDSTLTGLALDKDIIDKSFAVWNVGSQNTGSTVMIDREIVYTRSEQLSDGFVRGSEISMMCFAVSPSGRGPRCYPRFDEAFVTVPS